jgi:hypothetical protein
MLGLIGCSVFGSGDGTKMIVMLIVLTRNGFARGISVLLGQAASGVVLYRGCDEHRLCGGDTDGVWLSITPCRFWNEAHRHSLLRRSSHFGYEGWKLWGILRNSLKLLPDPPSPRLRRVLLASSYGVFGEGEFIGTTGAV